jgi:hypothetical protein
MAIRIMLIILQIVAWFIILVDVYKYHEDRVFKLWGINMSIYAPVIMILLLLIQIYFVWLKKSKSSAN